MALLNLINSGRQKKLLFKYINPSQFEHLLLNGSHIYILIL